VSLTAADVAEIMRLVEQSSFNEINLEMGEIRLHLRRGASGHNTADRDHSPPYVTSQPSAASSAPKVEPAAKVAAPKVVDANVHEVPSPLLGTFYRSPKPGAPPFVEVGTQVEEDTVVAIIEVMKLMNTVRAGVRGTVTEILLVDGALAEYSETLMRVRKG
jgi:acetyl-CoA carboxylase biotin carboxyl carrier protein